MKRKCCEHEALYLQAVSDTLTERRELEEAVGHLRALLTIYVDDDKLRAAYDAANRFVQEQRRVAQGEVFKP